MTALTVSFTASADATSQRYALASTPIARISSQTASALSALPA